jgi:hypothetical protein
VVGDAAQGFAGAQQWVSSGALPNLFAFDSILLVRKGKRSSGDGIGKCIGT